MKSRIVTLSGVRTIRNTGQTTIFQTGIDRFRENFTVNTQVTTGNRVTPNPLWFTKTVVYHPDGRKYVSSTTSGKTTENEITGTDAITLAYERSYPDYADTAYNKALDRYYEQLRGQLDLSISLFEGGQTTKMLKAVTKVSSYLRSFRPSQIGNKWLEYQYGWKPLLSDVYAVADKLVAKPTSPDRIIKARASEHYEDVIITNVSPGEQGARLRSRSVEAKWRTQLIGHYNFPNSVLLKLAGWSSLNPLSIAWELTPYSFVADWFIDVGSYLRATESALLYQQAFKSGTRTDGYYRSFVTSQEGVSTSSSGGTTTTTIDNAKIIGRETGMKRSILSGSPFPRLPQFKADLGSSRLFSAAALLSQFVGKKPYRSPPG